MPEFKTISINSLIKALVNIQQAGEEKLTFDSDIPFDMKSVILKGFASVNLNTLIKALETAKRLGEQELIIHTNLSYNAKAMILRGKKNHPLIYKKEA